MDKIRCFMFLVGHARNRASNDEAQVLIMLFDAHIHCYVYVILSNLTAVKNHNFQMKN